MPFTHARILTAVLLVATLAACGSSPGLSSAGQRVRAVAQSYFAALASGDGARACSLMTPPLRAQIIGAAVRTRSAALRGRNCAQLVGAVTKALGAGARQAVGRLSVSNIAVQGPRASATVKLRTGATQRLRFELSGTSWLLAGT